MKGPTSLATTMSMRTDITLTVEEAAEIRAMKQWIRPWEAPLYRLALNLSGTTHDAESVLAEILFRAWVEFGGLADEEGTYQRLVRVAVQEALPIMRARWGDISGWLPEPVQPLEEPPGEVIRWDESAQACHTPQESQEILLAALTSLSPLERVVFVLRDIEKFSTEQTSAALNLAVSQVRVRLQRARLLLREKLNASCRAARWPDEEQEELWAEYAELCT